MDETATTTTAPVPVEYVQPTLPGHVDALIEEWFLETFHNRSAVVHEEFNHFRRQADALKARLAAAMK